MNYFNFASILSIFGLLLISNGYSAPAESQTSDETKTEAVIEGNESNSTNDVVKTSAQLKEVCETISNHSKWMNNTCYSFHNVEEQSFDKAQKICSDEFKKYGFKNGRIYEPRNLDTFVKIYKMAEEYANYPTLQLWIGLHDYEKEGEFRYGSDKQLPKLKIPWGRSQPNGGKRENCLTSFIPDSGESPEWFDRPCVEFERNGEPGHRFMCECHVEEKNANDEVPNNYDDSTETENVSKNDISSTENTISVSTSASIENAEGSNPDSKVDITTTTTTEDTNQENNEISNSKETAEPLVQSDSPIAVPIDDSGRQFDGWSFFGGIILTIGIAAIAFLGVKYYKTRNHPVSLNYNLF